PDPCPREFRGVTSVPAEIDELPPRPGRALRAAGAAWLALLIFGASGFVPTAGTFARADEPKAETPTPAADSFYGELQPPGAESEAERQRRAKAKGQPPKGDAPATGAAKPQA